MATTADIKTTDTYCDENNARLVECFQGVGRKFGYDSVNAEFLPFNDMKIRWQRSYRWIDFKVSDYLSDAPNRVLTALANSLFSRILGEDYSYPESVRSWITAHSFCESKRPLYIERNKNISEGEMGSCRSLAESYQRLIGAGLVEPDPDIVVRWTRDSYGHRAGQSSVIMKVITVSRALDREDCPDVLLDYVLYHELCRIKIGFDPDGLMHDRFHMMDERFPEKKEAELWLRRLSMYV